MPPSLRVEILEDRSTPSAGSVLVTLKDVAASAPPIPSAAAVTPLGFGVYEVTPAAGYTPEAVAAAYASSPDVADARPDGIVEVERVSTDPMVSTQWALSKISAPAAWDSSTGTANTVVAVIDTGVDYNHPDLSSNLWVNSREVPGNGRDDDGNGFVDDIVGADFANNDGDPMDDQGHGTHIAGIIAAAGNNGLGVAGVVWRTRLMSLKFIPAGGSGYTSDAVRALNYAVTNGAKVVNASWGGGTSDPALLAAVQRARTSGVIVVAAAGNTGTSIDASAFYPASYTLNSDNVIAVGASDQNDNPASFSNRGAGTVSLFAPGMAILSTYPNNRYATLSGTSMATPFVTGAVALVWDRNPTWSYRQVIDRVLATTDLVPALTGLSKTGGRLDVAAAMGVVPPTVPPATPPAVPPSVPPAVPPVTVPPTTPAALTFKAGNVPIRIPDTGTATFWFDVKTDVVVNRLTASLTIQHPNNGDLLIELNAPDGRKVVLSNRRGGSGDNFTNTTWADSAATTIGSGSAPYAGTFKPESPLAALNGMNAKGRWTITVTDRVKGNAGWVTAAGFGVNAATSAAQSVERVQMWSASTAPPDGSVVLRPETQKLLGGDGPLAG